MLAKFRISINYTVDSCYRLIEAFAPEDQGVTLMRLFFEKKKKKEANILTVQHVPVDVKNKALSVYFFESLNLNLTTVRRKIKGDYCKYTITYMNKPVPLNAKEILNVKPFQLPAKYSQLPVLLINTLIWRIAKALRETVWMKESICLIVLMVDAFCFSITVFVLII